MGFSITQGRRTIPDSQGIARGNIRKFLGNLTYSLRYTYPGNSKANPVFKLAPSMLFTRIKLVHLRLPEDLHLLVISSFAFASEFQANYLFACSISFDFNASARACSTACAVNLLSSSTVNTTSCFASLRLRRTSL
jgi:hypothetical protein